MTLTHTSPKWKILGGSRLQLSLRARVCVRLSGLSNPPPYSSSLFSLSSSSPLPYVRPAGGAAAGDRENKRSREKFHFQAGSERDGASPSEKEEKAAKAKGCEKKGKVPIIIPFLGDSPFFGVHTQKNKQTASFNPEGICAFFLPLLFAFPLNSQGES